MAVNLNHAHLLQLSVAPNPKVVEEMLHLYSGYQLNFPSVIKTYHDLLLFYCAFPFTVEIGEQANAELKRIAATAREIGDKSNEKTKHALLATGIAHTKVICCYSSAIAHWLVKTFPDEVELDSSEASKEVVRNILQSLAPTVEYENTSQGELGLMERLKLISGLQHHTDLLKYLLRLFENSGLPISVREILYQQLNVFIGWQLSNDLLNRSFLRLPVKKIYLQKTLIKNVNGISICKQKIAKPVFLSADDKTSLMDTIKASLAFQYRETDAVTYADMEELELFYLGRGLQIALVGMIKEKRLALESYIGYMAFKNGIPVSYGGGWMWGQRCKIGINIFPSFRKGESAWLFCQVMRLYYQYFGVMHFVIKPYQFGKGNRDGLKSGAFWFYYKLGFRPVAESIKKEALAEWRKIQADKSYRTPVKTLQHFTTCNLQWIVSKSSFPSFDAGKLSAAVSTMINHKYGSDLQMAIAKGRKNLKKHFGLATSTDRHSYKENVIDNWCLLTALMDDAAGWNMEQKKAFTHLIQLKQSGKERDFVIQLQKHKSLWNSLEQVLLAY